MSEIVLKVNYFAADKGKSLIFRVFKEAEVTFSVFLQNSI